VSEAEIEESIARLEKACARLARDLPAASTKKAAS
jgi:acetylornithine/N-succinyldiaminopimelate aminotransferase